MREFVIKVPAPFSGVDDVGFSARYPEQEPNQPLRDVPFIVEGPPRLMERLVERLTLFTEKEHLVPEDGDDEAYTWTSPVRLTDEVVVLAFRDRSLRRDDGVRAERGYVWNLVRPLAFPFLRDCVRIGGLRLAERIAVVLDVAGAQIVDLELARSAITPDNGDRLLFGV